MNIRIFIYKHYKILSVLILVLLVHFSYIGNGFTWLDNGDIVSGRTLFKLYDLKGIFLNSFGATDFYRPLVTIINSLDNALYGKLAYGYHFTNVILHIIATLVVFLFTKSYFKVSGKVALLSSLIFGVHTVSWLPVGSISYRPEILVTIFTLLSIYSHIKTRLKEGNYEIYTYLFIILALLSKETAAIWIPLLIFAWEVGRKGNFRVRLKDIHLREIFLLALYLITRLAVFPLKISSQLNALDLSSALSLRLQVISKQLMYLISPIKPNLSDALQLKTLFNIESFIVLVAIFYSISLVRKHKLNHLYSKAIFFIGIALLPVLNIVHLPRINSPHYAYLASIGASVLIASSFYNMKIRFGKVIIVCWVVLSAFMTFTSGFQFENDKTLFSPEVRSDNNFLEGHFYLADYYFKNNDFKNAETHYEIANNEYMGAVAYVDKYTTKLNLAGVKLGLGKTSEAEQLLLELQKTERGRQDESVVYNLGLVYFSKEDFKKTVDTLSAKDNWTRAEPLLLLSKAYMALNLSEKAISPLEMSLEFLGEDQARNIKLLIEEIKKDSLNN